MLEYILFLRRLSSAADAAAMEANDSVITAEHVKAVAKVTAPSLRATTGNAAEARPLWRRQ